MTHKPAHWIEETTVESVFDLTGEPLAQGAGWSFWEHPEYGDEHYVLAVSLDYMGPNGPIIWNTRDFDVPDTL